MNDVQWGKGQEERSPGQAVLVIDADSASAALMAAALQAAGYGVTVADSLMLGLILARETRPALVVTELTLPDGDGTHVVTRLSRVDIPVMVVSTRADVASKVTLLEAGAADYVVKPFEVPEFLARVAVQVRNRRLQWARELLTVGELTLDVQRCLVSFKGKGVPLVRRERELLAVLMKDPERAFSVVELGRLVWGESEGLKLGNLLAVAVSSLRRKLRDQEAFGYLTTVHGFGYVLRRERKSSR